MKATDISEKWQHRSDAELRAQQLSAQHKIKVYVISSKNLFFIESDATLRYRESIIATYKNGDLI